jgi:hypothetical protein
MEFVYGMLVATVLIIVAEIAGNYGLGDVVKDLFEKTEVRLAGAKAKVATLEKKLAAEAKAKL